jgi:quercetin dioxygenase-like cupin family protein
MTHDISGGDEKLRPFRSPHDAYTSAVDAGLWPFDPRVPLPESFKNNNGTIQNLLLKPIQSVALIESLPGAVRASHYHKTDWHYALVTSGRVIYYEREVGSTEIPEPFVFGPGDMFFTPPLREHAMVFPVYTTILTFARNVRSHEEHEADLVRVNFFPGGVPGPGVNGP